MARLKSTLAKVRPPVTPVKISRPSRSSTPRARFIPGSALYMTIPLCRNRVPSCRKVGTPSQYSWPTWGIVLGIPYVTHNSSFVPASGARWVLGKVDDDDRDVSDHEAQLDCGNAALGSLQPFVECPPRRSPRLPSCDRRPQSARDTSAVDQSHWSMCSSTWATPSSPALGARWSAAKIASG